MPGLGRLISIDRPNGDINKRKKHKYAEPETMLVASLKVAHITA